MVFAVGESSSSSSSTPRSWTYDVFLSFRGEDTRKGFTGHLYAGLERKGIKTFKDDTDLERGEIISQDLLKAIQESMFAIVIFSPNYASSTWCLDELQQIVECQKQGLQVMPVFYGVDPSNVRHQRETFEKAFDIHEEKLGQHSEKVQKWRDALREVAGVSGWDSKDGDEAELVESIAQHIHEKLIPKLPSSRRENLVGIASRVEEVIGLMDMHMNDVRFIGIWGMGGIGKTTVAKAVYEAIRGDFQVGCFLRNVTEKAGANDLVHVQRELLSHPSIKIGYFHDLHDVKEIIRNSLCNKKVLLVLDDISQINHLENLAGEQDWFGPGSRIIITTRNVRLLTLHGVHKTYKVGGLAENEALHLFCLKAFKRDQPRNGYLDFSKEVVEYTRGLPLALEVLGSHLCGRPIEFWQSTLKQIRSSSFSKIQDRLKISYEGLDRMEKDLFLDIACFFKGMQKDKVVNILENRGKCPTTGIVVLIERSLISLNGWCELEMHDLLQEMGRDVVFQLSENDPGRQSRLWSQKDIDYVLTKNKGTGAIQGIVLNLSEQYQARWIPEAFSKTSRLTYLNLSGIQLPCGLNCLPSSLKVLHWKGCSLETLPLTNQPYEFVDIKLSHSKMEQLWHGEKFLEELKYLDLSFSENLKQLPDFSGIPNIETLVLEGCTSLTEVHASLLHHKKLVLMNLKDCRSLETLPGKLEMSSLEKLILTGCSQFKNIPEFGENMRHLSMLSLEGTDIRKLPSSIGYLVGLDVLDLKDCKLLLSLPDTINKLSSLRKLFLCGCSKFKDLPEFGESMNHLEVLSLEGTSITKLPSSLGYLIGLVILNLKDCKHLECLPDTIDRLRSLTNLDTSGCSRFGISAPSCSSGNINQVIKRNQSSMDSWTSETMLSTASASAAYSTDGLFAEWLSYSVTTKFSKRTMSRTQRTATILGVPSSVFHLPCLTSLNLSYCNLSGESTADNFSGLQLLKFLDLSGNSFVRVPLNISKLSKLEYLGLSHCGKLQSLPVLPSSIKELNASDCDSLRTSELSFRSLFASRVQCPPQEQCQFDMVIKGGRIPSWFKHKEIGEYVSFPLPPNYPLNERKGIALCFGLVSHDPSPLCRYTIECCLVSSAGTKTCIKKRLLPSMKTGCHHLYILFLPEHQFLRDSIHQDCRFGLFVKEKTSSASECRSELSDLKIKRGGARWVRKQDIEHEWRKKMLDFFLLFNLLILYGIILIHFWKMLDVLESYSKNRIHVVLLVLYFSGLAFIGFSLFVCWGSLTVKTRSAL